MGYGDWEVLGVLQRFLGEGISVKKKKKKKIVRQSDVRTKHKFGSQLVNIFGYDKQD